jgi:hypothetical protein
VAESCSHRYCSAAESYGPRPEFETSAQETYAAVETDTPAFDWFAVETTTAFSHETTTAFSHETTTAFPHETATTCSHKSTTAFSHEITTAFPDDTTTTFSHETTTAFPDDTTTAFPHETTTTFSHETTTAFLHETTTTFSHETTTAFPHDCQHQGDCEHSTTTTTAPAFAYTPPACAKIDPIPDELLDTWSGKGDTVGGAADEAAHQSCPDTDERKEGELNPKPNNSNCWDVKDGVLTWICTDPFECPLDEKCEIEGEEGRGGKEKGCLE